MEITGTWRLDASDLPDPWDVSGVHPDPRKGRLVKSAAGNVVLSACADDPGVDGVYLFIGGWMLRTQVVAGPGGVVGLPPHEPSLYDASELAQEHVAFVGRGTEAVSTESFSVSAGREVPQSPDTYQCPVPLLVLVVEAVRNICSHADAHSLFNETPWPPNSSHGTSTIEAARLVVPLPLTNTRIVARFPLKQVQFVGKPENKDEIQIKSTYSDNGAVFADFTVRYAADDSPVRESGGVVISPVYDTWLLEERRYWETRVWDTFEAVSARGFSPQHLRGYRPVAIPSWPIPLLPPELWAAYPTTYNMPSLGAPGSQRLREQLAVLTTVLDIGVRTAGTLYNVPAWVSDGLEEAAFARIVGRQVQSTSDKLNLDFVWVLEALMAACTVLCTPVTPYITEVMREHFACLAHVSADCEDFAHFVCAFMLHALFGSPPLEHLAGYPHLIAIRWILRTLYWPVQTFYETGAAAANSETSGARQAHQAAMLLPLPFVWQACQRWGDANADLLTEMHWPEGPQLAWPDAVEREALGVTDTSGGPCPPWFLEALPVLAGEGTAKTAALGTPLTWIADVTRPELAAMDEHLTSVRLRGGRLGIKQFAPSLHQANVFGVEMATLVPDRFMRYATVVCFTPRTVTGVPLQASWTPAEGTTGITYQALLAGPHDAPNYAKVHLRQNTPPVGDRLTYRRRLDGALAATMLAVDRPRLMRSRITIAVPGLPAFLARTSDWTALVRLPEDALSSYACFVVPLRYVEGVLKRLWATEAGVCTTTIMHTPWSPASNGVAVVLLFIADQDVG